MKYFTMKSPITTAQLLVELLASSTEPAAHCEG